MKTCLAFVKLNFEVRPIYISILIANSDFYQGAEFKYDRKSNGLFISASIYYVSQLD